MTASTVVFLLDQVWMLCSRAVGRRARVRAVALLYHSVPAAHRNEFSRQMDLLCRLASPVRADVRTPLDASRRHVSVTFDDGLSSFAETAWPELEKRNIPAAVFVVAGRLGTVPGWANYSPGLMPSEKMLTEEQLRRLPETVVVGSHSLTHRMLTEIGEGDSRYEIRESRSRLEELLQRRIHLFSFPYGERSNELIRQCAEAGYERVFTSLPVHAFAAPDEFETGRVDVQATDWSIEFRLKVVGAYRWLPYAFATKRAVMGLFTRTARATSSNVPERQG